MRWQQDVTVGDWIRDRLDPAFASMHGVVPHGFEAYARIFHPASVRSVPGGVVPTDDELQAMPDEEFDRTVSSFRDEDIT